MAYEPTDWICGEDITADALNKLERGVAEVLDGYVPTVWSDDDIITADRMNKLEQGVADAFSRAITVESLDVTENGIYSASSGHAYSPVSVSVPTGGGGITADEVATRTISGVVSGSAERIEWVAFDGTLIEGANFPNAWRIADNAFHFCTSLATASFPNVTSLGSSAFYRCEKLVVADFPNAERVGSATFYSCYALTTANFPSAQGIGSSAFEHCEALVTTSFPNVATAGSFAFAYCYALSTISFPVLTNVASCMFMSCSALMSVYLLSSKMVTLNSTNAFAGTPMSNSSYTGSFGSIYVPESLVASYKTRTGWSLYASRITAYEEQEGE